MGNIDIINRIAADRQKAKEIACRVQSKRAQGDNRTFADVLQEELDNHKKATKDTDQDSPR
jgi:flagellar hook-basal body complex protein FliE